jgi:hypothetical protein
MSPESISSSFPGVEVCDRVDAADWVVAAREPWTRGRLTFVSSLVPADYPAHGRVLHAAWLASSSEHVRWAAIAAQTGGKLDAATRFNELVGWERDAQHQSPPEPWGQPDPGSLNPDECAAVAEVLVEHTTTPEACWFCVWEGYGTGWPVLNQLGETAPRVKLEHRDCLLFRGPVRAATAFRSGPWFQSPTLWWPEDRAWCVASELDIFSTYLGASAEALRALIAHPDLEVLECAADEHVDLSPYPARFPNP